MPILCPSWLSWILYNPVRKMCTDREQILDESGITTDSVVLEIGAGNGFLTEVIAARARQIFAAELQSGMVKKLRKRAHGFGNRVQILQGDIASQPLNDIIADVCLIYYSFHEVSNKTDAVRNISSAIKPGGILSIYEPTVEVSKTAMETTIGLFLTHGFKEEKRRDGLFTRFARLRKGKHPMV